MDHPAAARVLTIKEIDMSEYHNRLRELEALYQRLVKDTSGVLGVVDSYEAPTRDLLAVLLPLLRALEPPPPAKP